MSSTRPLQCLFCKHINPPDAGFCRVCDSQLDLQPCEQCGAVDNRAAKTCYKCGAKFVVGATSEFGAEPEPVSFDATSIDPATTDTSVTRLMATLSHLDSTHTATERQPIAVRVPSDMGATATRSLQRWLFFGVPLLLTLIAISAYVMDMQSAKLPQQQQVTQPLPAPSNESIPLTATAQLESAVKPTNVQSTPQIDSDRLNSLVSHSPTGAGVTLTDRSAPATEEEPSSGQNSLPRNECPQEVATLGLCSPDIKKEKQ